MEKIKLLPEQAEKIEKRVKELTNQIKSLRNDINNGEFVHVIVSGGQGFNNLPDIASFQELGRLSDELRELNETLRNAEILKVYDAEKIEIGTKFVTTLKKKNSVETTKHVLVDGAQHILELLSSEYKPVSINSPFGQAVRSKKVNELVTFATPNDGLVVGIVDEIVPVNEKNLSENSIQLTR